MVVPAEWISFCHEVLHWTKRNLLKKQKQKNKQKKTKKKSSYFMWLYTFRSSRHVDDGKIYDFFFLNNKMCFILLRILYIILQRFEFFFNINLSNLSFFGTQNFPKTSLNFLTVRLFLTILTFIRIVKIITRITIQISKASFGQSTKN